MQGLRARIGDEGLEDEQSGTGLFIQHFADLGRERGRGGFDIAEDEHAQSLTEFGGFEGDDVGTRGRFRRGPCYDPVDG